jgi:EAL domain-containing protein (putative c-di-GMP-specific phosphodiesterase class I)
MRPRSRRRRIRHICSRAELRTVFQPLIELESKKPVAYEALTRFPGQACSTRDCFADAAEIGMALDLELAALRSAFAHLAGFPPAVRLAINVSPAVAITDEFFDLVAPVAARLIVELTEHEPVEEYGVLAEALSRLRDMGAYIAIDDVGAGFASLRHILRLSPDILKLDGSLTHGIETDSGTRALTSALIDFAEDTGALITAEGIETEGELELLCELGVDHGQGYLLGRPQPLVRHLRPEPLVTHLR